MSRYVDNKKCHSDWESVFKYFWNKIDNVLKNTKLTHENINYDIKYLSLKKKTFD